VSYVLCSRTGKVGFEGDMEAIKEGLKEGRTKGGDSY